MAQVFKTPIEQAQNLTKTPSTREKWNKYLKYGLRGTNPKKWNSTIEEIESELPFANEIEHQKWIDLGSLWKGEPEWLNLTEELLKRQETPSPFDEIRYKDKVYKKGIDYK